MLAISDSLPFLRDGEVVGDVKAERPRPTRYVHDGRPQHQRDYYRSDSAPDYSDEVVLAAENLTVEGEIEDVSFELHKGEILGFVGLSDSGIHSVGKAVFGLSKAKRGRVVLASGSEIRSTRDAIAGRMGYVPKDRDNEALMIRASIFHKATLPSLNELKRAAGFLSPRRLNKLSADIVDKLSVKCTGIHQSMDALSGGNKQKVNLGRWLAKDLKVLVLDCPTRGVDVGVKGYIYELMKQAKAEGIAMILISDELTEALGMADRLIVMKDGRAVRTILRGEDFTERSIIEVMI
jgi:ribose transport system ATP-binding protein